MPKTVYDHISANNRKTLLLALAFPLVFVAIVFLFLWAAIAMSSPSSEKVMNEVLSTTLMVAVPTIIVCLTWLLISLACGDSMMLNMTGAQEISDKSAEYKQLFRNVENVAIAAGLPMPRVFIIEDEALNAFATGLTPKRASVAFTSGLVNSLDKLEFESVIAHEMAHIGNRDIRLDMMLVTGVGVTMLIGDILLRMAFRSTGGRSNNNGKGAAIVLAIGLAFMIFNFIIAPLLRMAMSRKREFAADATGAFITRNPSALASALRKIGKHSQVKAVDRSKLMASVFIADPLKKSSVAEFFNNLYSTHPPVSERIKRLENM